MLKGLDSTNKRIEHCRRIRRVDGVAIAPTSVSFLRLGDPLRKVGVEAE